jgi:hypothetical protein
MTYRIRTLGIAIAVFLVTLGPAFLNIRTVL